MGLDLVVLGCSGSYPGPASACSGYLLRSATTTVWLDAGSGTLANLQRHVRLSDVDAVVLSHEHPDHWSDVEGYFVACAYVVSRPGSVPVYAPAAVRPLLAMDTGDTFEWHDVRHGSEVGIGDLRLTFCRTAHTEETLAVRIDGGGVSIGYSADTGPEWSLAELGPGLDLALCEATYLQADEGKVSHLSGRQAGLTAKEAGARRLVVTHMWPTVDPSAVRDEAEASFGSPVEVAHDNARFRVGT